MTLTSFRMNTYEKRGEGGTASLPLAGDLSSPTGSSTPPPPVIPSTARDLLFLSDQPLLCAEIRREHSWAIAQSSWAWMMSTQTAESQREISWSAGDCVFFVASSFRPRNPKLAQPAA